MLVYKKVTRATQNISQLVIGLMGSEWLLHGWLPDSSDIRPESVVYVPELYAIICLRFLSLCKFFTLNHKDIYLAALHMSALPQSEPLLDNPVVELICSRANAGAECHNKCTGSCARDVRLCRCEVGTFR
jgi:hypothetical protein